MIFSSLSFLFGFLVLAFALAESLVSNGDIYLGTHNASSILETQEIWFVTFTKSGEAFKDFNDIWEASSSAYPNLHHAKVFCDLESEFCKSQGVLEYPQIAVLRNGAWMRNVLDDSHHSVDSALEFVEAHLTYCQLESLKTGSNCLTEENYDEHLDSREAVFGLEEDESWKRVNSLRKAVNLVFRDFLEDSENILSDRAFVMFYSTTKCPDCFQWEPIWLSITRDVADELTMGYVNCDSEEDLCAYYHVDKYPTFIAFQKLDAIKYEGPLNYRELSRYANQLATYQTLHVQPEEIESIEHTHTTFFIFFHDYALTLEDVQSLKRMELYLAGNAPLFQSDSAALAERYGVHALPAFVSVRNGEPFLYQANTPRQFRSHERIRNWIRQASLPLASELSPVNCHKMVDRKLSVIALLNPESESYLGDRASLLNFGKHWFQFQKRRERNFISHQRVKKYTALTKAKKSKNQKKIERIKYSTIEHPIFTESVSFLWTDSTVWQTWLLTNLGYSETLTSEVTVFIVDNEREIFYTQGHDGKPLKLDEPSLFSTLRAILDNSKSIPHQEMGKATMCGGEIYHKSAYFKPIIYCLFLFLSCIMIIVLIHKRRRAQPSRMQPILGFMDFHPLVTVKAD
ncbi:ER membrane protein disulfide isomerase Pdi4 [Schizosaccharomyces osmophilus]|uniref:ER membrane protein disulfide isomerase Pdi4 n=1 Tax=Schizosaccharomyces osmophilus TaxID=2545709 RepID=A0AAE9WAY3_9SCHI|nr:ER membrane protein disulfide isomerase Pdi4 [Schizosaccharomyces osmophilus]WBW71258.1 ER membrane protein disulfide isomerase Pdi4 [Schizosaccharomyces osmophilus]